MSWMARGRRASDACEQDGHEPEKADAPFVALYEQVYRARAHAAPEAIIVIRAAARDRVVYERERTWHDPQTGEVTFRQRVIKKKAGDWRAAAWWLERTFPEEYGRSCARCRSDTPSVSATANSSRSIQPEPPTLADRIRHALAQSADAASKEEA
ncbi:hypothetical protein AB0G73_31965 [Streptomyces sp. NPDC020719]|uniref:hypothetical protein n=1 Tax=Streptomyces sp. NPDC020719 TaxID=3154896 RepID=UPI0033C1C3A9